MVIKKNKKIDENFEKKTVDFAELLDNCDRVWNTGLLYKCEKISPARYYNIVKSKLDDQHFQIVVVNDKQSALRKIRANVPQGSILRDLAHIQFLLVIRL